MARFIKNTESSFWADVDVRGPDDCWEFKGSKNKKGYATYRWEGRKQGAHRVAYKITHGSLSDAMKVCHTCDNPPCCNPKHLFEGTQKTNMQDCSAKGRAGCGAGSPGEKNGWSKLTDWQVVGVMARLLTGREKQTEIARSLDVNKVTVSSIWLGKTWTHLFS